MGEEEQSQAKTSIRNIFFQGKGEAQHTSGTGQGFAVEEMASIAVRVKWKFL